MNIYNIIEIAWSAWRETSGVAYDRNLPTQVKENVHKKAIQSVLTYGAQCWAVRKTEKRNLHTTEMWAGGKNRIDHVRNVDIWKEAHMYPMA